MLKLSAQILYWYQGNSFGLYLPGNCWYVVVSVGCVASCEQTQKLAKMQQKITCGFLRCLQKSCSTNLRSCSLAMMKIPNIPQIGDTVGPLTTTTPCGIVLRINLNTYINLLL